MKNLIILFNKNIHFFTYPIYVSSKLKLIFDEKFDKRWTRGYK